jgi:tRNA(Ile)-lysidine synthase
MLKLPLKDLSVFPQIKRFIVAYSGGLDSHVLLHAVAALREALNGREVVALHVNHGLSANAAEWSAHCATQCEKLGVPFTNINVDAKPEMGESPEAAARDARYQAFGEFMQAGDCLLTAHHQDDQAETLLIQLLRGAGPRGLASMPVQAQFASGWHVRPFLAFKRDALEAYARDQGLEWIDDESNFDTGFDRNFLRHEILPLLKQRFPAVAATLSRSASLCAEATEILLCSAKVDLESVRLNEQTLSVSRLQDVGEVRGRNVLHEWIRSRGLPTSSAAQLQRVWEDVIGAGPDSNPVVTWTGAEVRRYRDELFVDKPLAPHDADQCLNWDGQKPLLIPGLGTLSLERITGQGIAESFLNNQACEIRFRQGGEQLRPAGREGHHALKKLFQEAGVPPWQRNRIPLLYVDDQLLAVAGHWVAHEMSASAGNAGFLLHWSGK